MVAAVLLLLASCGSEPNIDEVVARTGESSYGSPGLIGVTITNNSSEAVQSSFCPVSFDRRSGDAWEATLVEEPCHRVTDFVPAGGDVTPLVSVPAGLAAGDYRIRFAPLATENGQPLGTLYTNTFRIE